jgi:putative transposase
VIYAFIQAEKAAFPVAFMCARLGVSRSGFYDWRRRGPSARAQSDARLARDVAAIHRVTCGRYGSPRVHAELRARGQRVGRKRVARLMRAQGLAARRRRRFVRTTDSRHADPIAPNVVARDFTATAPNRVWVTDITYIATGEGWLYLAAILDLFSRRVVGWALDASLATPLALAALDQALRRRDPPRGLVHHSDRGCQYASGPYRAALTARGLTASMSRAGDCWDNAVAESFFNTLKWEAVPDAGFATHAAARAALGAYLDDFYNHERRHSSLGYASPVEFELRAVSTAA